jgi:hypothetical protein
VDEAEPVILQLAAGSLTKQEFTDWARRHMHEKPKLELRDFFNRISSEDFAERFRSLLPAETGAGPLEFKTRREEVGVAIPLLLDLGRQQREAAQAATKTIGIELPCWL